jgi:hypothetical protein
MHVALLEHLTRLVAASLAMGVREAVAEPIEQPPSVLR